jgi:hypothetical protein
MEYLMVQRWVFASDCGDGVSSQTKVLTNLYAQRSGYTPSLKFGAYPLTGDMMNWLAKINVPAISVLLTNYTSTEWTRNYAGIMGVINSFKDAN